MRPRLVAHTGPLTINAAARTARRARKGDVLLELDAAQIRNDVTAAESELASAKANLDKAQSDLASAPPATPARCASSRRS